MITTPKLTINLIDVTALDDSTPSTTDIQSFADITQIKQDFYTPKFSTLEQDQWRGDGTFEIFPSNPASYEWGQWSDQLSDANGDFATPITLTVTFGSVHTSKGLTFEFWEDTEDYANDITVKWYNSSDILIAQANFSPNQSIYFANQLVTDYKKVEVTFKSTNKPYHYLKLKSIQYGEIVVFLEDQLNSLNIVEEVDLTSDQVSINQMKARIKFDDSQTTYEVISTLQETQKTTIREIVDGILYDMGTFYIRDRKLINDKTLEITCEDLLGIIDDKLFLGGFYNNVTAGDLIDSIFAEYGTNLYYLEPSIANRTISGYIPVCTFREAIQSVALAINAVVNTSRDNRISIYSITDDPVKTITRDECFTYMQDAMDKQFKIVTGVSLTIKRYELDTSSTQEVYKATHSSGTYTATFTDPASNLSISGGTIIESDVNYVTFSTTGATVTISGNIYKTFEQIEEINTPNLPSNIAPKIIAFENTLVWDMDQNVQYLYDFETLKTKVTLNKVLGNEVVGDYMQVSGFFGQNFEGYIVSCETDLAKGFRGEMTAYGNLA